MTDGSSNHQSSSVDDEDWQGWPEDEEPPEDESVESRQEALAAEHATSAPAETSTGSAVKKQKTMFAGGFWQDNGDMSICEECESGFTDSLLMRQFNCKVCDECRDKDGKHALITKTDSKNEYFLKDSDLDNREPSLKCIIKKNPHNNSWGDMKLYLRCQVEDRAIEVWGSEEAIEAERERRDERKEQSKKRTFDKMIKELRMNARSSLGKQVRANHEHDFDGEEYDEERDVYSKKCKTCDHVNEYEKM